jgi:hypothetical protein
MGRRIRQSKRSANAGGFPEATYGSVIGLGDQTIIVFGINLNDRRALRVETRADRQSCQKSSSCNGDSSGVDHPAGLWIA